MRIFILKIKNDLLYFKNFINEEEFNLNSKKIYPLILPIKKKYYESFYNDIMKIKQKDIDVRNIKEELLREKIIDQ